MQRWKVHLVLSGYFIPAVAAWSAEPPLSAPMHAHSYPSIPLLANLRCGLWYAPSFDGTCYFKSTDGHNGNWSFSTTRLNMHVAAQAAAAGGVLIVDATRKGKTFPVRVYPVVDVPMSRFDAKMSKRRQHKHGSGRRLCRLHHAQQRSHRQLERSPM